MLGPGSYEPDLRQAGFQKKEKPETKIRKKLRKTAKWSKNIQTVPSIPSGNKMLMLSDDEDGDGDAGD